MSLSDIDSSQGYERASQPQVLPRKVSKFAHKVIDVALSVRVRILDQWLPGANQL